MQQIKNNVQIIPKEGSLIGDIFHIRNCIISKGQTGIVGVG